MPTTTRHMIERIRVFVKDTEATKPFASVVLKYLLRCLAATHRPCEALFISDKWGKQTEKKQT